MRPLPEATGKVLELGSRVPRVQPQDLQQVPRGRGNGGLEVHGLPRLQVNHILDLQLLTTPSKLHEHLKLIVAHNVMRTLFWVPDRIPKFTVASVNATIDLQTTLFCCHHVATNVTTDSVAVENETTYKLASDPRLLHFTRVKK